MKSTLALAGLLPLVLVGCIFNRENSNPSTQPATKIPATYQTIADLKPDVNPPEKGNLILGGTPIAVQLDPAHTATTLTLNWMVDSEGRTGGDPVKVESEKYTYSDAFFAFAGTDYEKYDPPIPLAKFPLTVGEGWDWTGSVQVGKTKTKAKATIDPETETLNLAVGNIDALKVTVVLTFDDESAPKQRTLVFWFKPGEGIIKRELWSSSTREPRPSSPVGREEDQ